MMKTILVSICVLAMVTTAYLACVPVSATSDTTSIDIKKSSSNTTTSIIPPRSHNPMPLYTSHQVTLGDWYIDYENCVNNSQDEPYQGLYIGWALYKDGGVINPAYQSGILYSRMGDSQGYTDYLDTAVCTYSHWTDGGGYVHYGNLYTFTNPHGITGLIIYYNVSFTAFGAKIEFWQQFKVHQPSGCKIIAIDAWWKIGSYVDDWNATSIVKKGNTQLTKEYENTTAIWGTETIQVNANRKMYTDGSGASSSTIHKWAVFVQIEDYFHHDYSADDQETLPNPDYPMFSEYLYKGDATAIPTDTWYNGYTLWTDVNN